MRDREVESVLRRPALFDPDAPEVQAALPLIGTPHDHPGPIRGVSRHTTLYTGGQAYLVCPRDCPDRSRSLQPKH
jgi:hypothetical protein